ncbi:hypothetical protein LXL04_030733 [Taraxacum kok-saghyz]
MAPPLDFAAGFPDTMNFASDMGQRVAVGLQINGKPQRQPRPQSISEDVPSSIHPEGQYQTHRVSRENFTTQGVFMQRIYGVGRQTRTLAPSWVIKPGCITHQLSWGSLANIGGSNENDYRRGGTEERI